jgi:hypothetical protein
MAAEFLLLGENPLAKGILQLRKKLNLHNFCTLWNSCSWQNSAAEIIISTGGISVTSGNPVDSAVEESLSGS